MRAMSKSLPTDFGQRLRRLRESKHLTQRELHTASGVHFVNIQQFESGERTDCRRSTIEKLAKGLGVSPAALLSEASSEPAEDVLKDYKSSGWYPIDQPSDSELEKIRAVPARYWGGAAPSADLVHDVVLKMRKV